MAKKAKDAAAKYLEELLKKVPEKHRKAVQEALADPESGDALDFLGDGVLGQAEVSRLSADAQKLIEQNTADLAARRKWYEDNLPLLEKGAAADKVAAELKKAEKKLKALADDPDAEPEDSERVTAGLEKKLEGFMTAEQAKALVAEQLRNVANTQQAWGLDIATTLADLATEHLHTYKKPLKTRELIAFAQKNSSPSIIQAYADYTKEDRDTLEAAKAKDHETEIETRIRKQIESEQSSRGHGLFPIATNEPSTLSGLKKDGGPVGIDPVAQQASDFYQSLVSKKGA